MLMRQLRVTKKKYNRTRDTKIAIIHANVEFVFSTKNFGRNKYVYGTKISQQVAINIGISMLTFLYKNGKFLINLLFLETPVSKAI